MVYVNGKYSSEKWDSVERTFCPSCGRETFYRRRRKYLTKNEFETKSYIFHEYFWCATCNFVKMVNEEKIYMRKIN